MKGKRSFVKNNDNQGETRGEMPRKMSFQRSEHCKVPSKVPSEPLVTIIVTETCFVPPGPCSTAVCVVLL